MNLLNKLLESGIEKSEAKKEIDILFSEFKDDLNKIKEIIEIRSKTRKPLQYILGKTHFMDFEIKVNENVLIPRPETEILVEETIKRFLPNTALDIGTGSGNIAIALAKKIPDIKIVAIDINKEIINLAKENAKNCDVEEKIKFKVCDVFSDDFEKLLLENKFDLIISNPPYVINFSQPEVKHEPEIALFGNVENKSGMIYYERIIGLCRGDLYGRFFIDQFSLITPVVPVFQALLIVQSVVHFLIFPGLSEWRVVLQGVLFLYCLLKVQHISWHVFQNFLFQLLLCNIQCEAVRVPVLFVLIASLIFESGFVMCLCVV